MTTSSKGGLHPHQLRGVMDMVLRPALVDVVQLQLQLDGERAKIMRRRRSASCSPFLKTRLLAINNKPR